jgi:hypothetical protein
MRDVDVRILRMFLRKCGLDSADSRYSTVVVSCELGNELWCSIEGGQFLDQPSDHIMQFVRLQVLVERCVPFITQTQLQVRQPVLLLYMNNIFYVYVFIYLNCKWVFTRWQ